MLYHPYEELTGGEWLRGNLHTHTTRSDGSRDVQTVLNDYAERGYDFLSLSDHDIYTSAEDYGQWDGRGMILIPGNEITRNGPHMLHVHADQFVEPVADRQAAIDAVTSGQGFVIVNHPDWQSGFNHCPIENLRAWKGYAGIEIYNGVICRLDGSPYALRKWETLLTEGRRVWGYANDDSHSAVDVALGWNVVYARERTPSAVVEALRTGRFYASTGVKITAIQTEGNRIHIETTNAERIVAHTKWGHREAVVDAPEITLDVPEHLPYVRFECWGRGEQFAWTQPFFTTPPSRE
jgi:hypothetical protein